MNASGVVLTPNRLAVLDKLGVLERIRDKCWTSEYRTYKNRDVQTAKKVRVAGENWYGYKNHRIWRRELQDCLRDMVSDKGVRIEYEMRFEEVVDEDDDKVVFRINGERVEAGMLVGADGIYSSVRRYLDREVEPEYSGVFGVLGHIRYDEVDWPEGLGEKHFTIQDKPGGNFMIPEDRAGVEGMVGLQKHLKKEEWETIEKDKERLCDFCRESYQDWGETARRIIDVVCQNKQSLYAWPFMSMPKLERWSSEEGRVVLVGHSARAIPPSSGQGVNQALEDVWTLTALSASGRELRQALDFWLEMRPRRIYDVVEQVMAKANGHCAETAREGERQKLMSEGSRGKGQGCCQFWRL